MKSADEIKNDLSGIAEERISELETRLTELDRENHTERKALHICLNLLGICKSFPQYDFGGNFTAVAYRRVFEDAHYFDGCAGLYAGMDENERERFLRYAFPVTLLRRAFLDERRAKLAEPGISTDDAFESRLIVSVVESVLADWGKYAANEGLPAAEAEA